jgi:transcriptional regulator NrdR family protein
MAGKIPKTIEEVQNRLESTIDKIDVSKLDFGDIKMSQETNEFIQNEENNLQEIIDYLNEFTNKLSARKKEQVKTEKINEKLMNEIKEGGEKASLIAQIFNN